MSFISSSQLKTVEETLVDNLKKGVLEPAHSQVADNLTPYNEDSGVMQDAPFISQGTGTDNNSAIVTTGVIAKQLEKQGNTLSIMQLANELNATNWSVNYFTSSYLDGVATLTLDSDNVNARLQQDAVIIQGHKYYVEAKVKTPYTQKVKIGLKTRTTNAVESGSLTANSYNTVRGIIVAAADNAGDDSSIRIYPITETGVYQVNDQIKVKDVICFDITSWGSDIITDLTTNPSHFSWYYNGSMAYDAGSLQNCNGRYLECGQGRNLWDEETVVVSGHLETKNFTITIPNSKLYFKSSGGAGNGWFWYDSNKNLVSTIYPSQNTIINVPRNASYFKFAMGSGYGTTYKHDITISLYYTPEQGGEGYNQHYDYVAPKRVDMGTETLLAFDTKDPDGTVHRNTGTFTFTSDTDVSFNSTYGFAVITDLVGLIKAPASDNDMPNIILAGYIKDVNSHAISNDYNFIITVTANGGVRIKNTSWTSKTDALNALLGKTIQYELAIPATEQGTPFDEYVDINDYSYMAWFDTDGNLVSIPQGCKLFYPVDYKGFTDDLVMYTNGDATAIALEDDITDTALAERGYYKMQDLSSNITDNAGLTYSRKYAYKTGNIVTITIRAKNSTGSSIVASTNLFELGSGLFNTDSPYASVGYVGETLARISILTTGYVVSNAEIANGDTLYFNITYAVA